MVISELRHRLNNGQTSNRYTVFTEPQISGPSDQPGMDKKEDTKQDIIDLPQAKETFEQIEIPEYIPNVPADIPAGENPMVSTVPGRQVHSCLLPRRQKYISAKPLTVSRLLKLRLMTPQETNSTTKATLKQRKKDFISKMAKWKLLHKRKYESDKSGDG
ncbi:hypothetical protein [Caproiciproducens sp. CPB-2]|uniref:hypothetical protein n=1 Tax=Caproiciproducens sp. CPB-2 TaxID=3030017 RepID=UPI0023DCA19A|nr:hypothetical protein [Caproiciproducens sp. CPB-2]MDF1493940.1 hypothetical protein [Caproiciproducens sp. CPB-2]